MGGYLALELALRHPELVTSLTLCVAAGGVDMARHGARDWRPEAAAAGDRSAWSLAPTPDLTAQLGRIAVPVLLIWAERDPISPLAVAEVLLARLPDARLLQFDTDDHWVARARAPLVARALVDFLAGGLPRGSRTALP
jgi:pimeloyl-ACP methyl ester carboxylesterase